jgi:hypothetical protein
MRTFSTRVVLGAFAVAVLLAAGAPAVAETVTYKASLDGASEVPPNDSKGTGMIEAKYDTTSMKLSWTATYSGLSGDVTAAHFHGPAKPGVNAGPVITLSGSLASPLKGEATLTAPQAADLEAGLWYLNIHTAKHQPGEIRGQLMRAP